MDRNEKAANSLTLKCLTPSRRRFAASLAQIFALTTLIPDRLSSNTAYGAAHGRGYCDESGIRTFPALKYFDTGGPNAVVTDYLHVGRPFETTAIFDEGIADYTDYEFRQYLKGYICCRKNDFSTWQCIALHIKGGKIIDPYSFQEDGIGDAAYGYRGSGGCSDDFGPCPSTRQNGWLYTAADFPGMKDVRGTEYQVKLDFSFQIINIKTGASSEPKLLSISCYGQLPEVKVGSLPDQPPVVPSWLNSDQEHKKRVVLTELKSFHSAQYHVRLILNIQEPTSVIDICFIKPNGSPPITAFIVELQLSDGSPIRISRQADGDPITEARSGGTTAQTSVELSSSDLQKLIAVSISLDLEKVSFTAQELQLN
jgi:hypothetical protein